MVGIGVRYKSERVADFAGIRNKTERMGEARRLNMVANDRTPRPEDKPPIKVEDGNDIQPKRNQEAC